MKAAIVQVVRSGGEVIFTGAAVPFLVAHGDPEVWSYDLSGLPPVKAGDTIRVTTR